MRSIFLLTAPLLLVACGNETDDIETVDSADVEVAGDMSTDGAVSRGTEPTDVGIAENGASMFTEGRWFSEDAQAVYGQGGGRDVVSVRCEEDEDDLVITRSIPLGVDDQAAMAIIAGDARAEGYWRGMGEALGLARARVPVGDEIVDAMTTADRIVFRAEGFGDVVTPNSDVLETVTRRCTVAR